MLSGQLDCESQFQLVGKGTEAQVVKLKNWRLLVKRGKSQREVEAALRIEPAVDEQEFEALWSAAQGVMGRINRGVLPFAAALFTPGPSGNGVGRAVYLMQCCCLSLEGLANRWAYLMRNTPEGRPEGLGEEAVSAILAFHLRMAVVAKQKYILFSDYKPGNVMLNTDGQMFVIDYT